MKQELLRLLSLGGHCKQREPAFSYSKWKMEKASAFVKVTVCRRHSHTQESLYRDLVTISSASQIKPGCSVCGFDTDMAMNCPVNSQAGMLQSRLCASIYHCNV